jgi:hypothetical protein
MGMSVVSRIGERREGGEGQPAIHGRGGARGTGKGVAGAQGWRREETLADTMFGEKIPVYSSNPRRVGI